MTALQAQAVKMMDGLSDEHLRRVIDFIKGLSSSPTEDDAEMTEAMKAFHRLTSSHLDFPEDFDPDKERWEALKEKYGPFTMKS
ncbi:MAG: hypothetical protein IJS96_00730 [Schwartzia sp.]|nr:hypothetical protein [Schwartzia sp. (in: firmicutes)]